jgi:hypothetical protein
MLKIVNPRSGKVYTYAERNAERAHALAAKLGVRVEYGPARAAYETKTCVCGRPEDTHDGYDCLRDLRIAGWPAG